MRYNPTKLLLALLPPALTLSVLLGHNGAGKTTAMSMMVGYFPATSGTILLNDINVFEDVVTG